MPSETLELCDIIDMPGISDPNMSSSVWQSVVHQADSVIWCTHATQAWRQSEAAVWEKLSGTLNARNILLVTHIDKLQTERELARVLQRVQKEAGPQFDAIFPVALTEAVAAGDDEEKWKQSGAGPFVEYLIETLMDPSFCEVPSQTSVVREPIFDEQITASDPAACLVDAARGADDQGDGSAIMPKRIKPSETDGRGRSARLARTGLMHEY
jgi:hypothetical protein